MGTAAGTAKSPSHIPSSPGAVCKEPDPALHMFLQLDLHHSWSTVEEEEEGEEGRQEASCLLGSAGYPPACSWGWGFEGRVGPAETSLVRRSRAIVCVLSAKEQQGAAVRLVIPAAASSSLPSQEKTLCFHCRHTPSSWAGGNAPGSAVGSAARASPCPPSPPMVGRHGARPWEQKSKECIPAGLPALAAPCLPRAFSWAQTLSQWGIGRVWAAACPHWHPSDKHPRHCTRGTFPIPAPAPHVRLMPPCAGPRAGKGQPGTWGHAACGLTVCDITLQVPEAMAQETLVGQWPWYCHGSVTTVGMTCGQGARSEASVPEWGQASSQSQPWLSGLG